MRKIILNITIALISFSFLNFANSAENKTELNFFTGMFDFSDTKQAAGVLGLQHQNDELFMQTKSGITISKYTPSSPPVAPQTLLGTLRPH